MKKCCGEGVDPNQENKKNADWFLWSTFSIVAISYFFSLFFRTEIVYLREFTFSVFDLMNRMSWGLLIGIIFVGLLDKVSKEFVQKLMGRRGSFIGIVKATFAGVFLDMCSHGILLVGTRLYNRGLSLGQTMAFLIASPWNSLSLTFVLWGLIGFKWTMIFLLASIVVAIISGLVFNILVDKKVLASNPNTSALPPNYSAKKELKELFTLKNWKPKKWHHILWNGLTGSKMILKWIFFGVIAAALLRTFITPEQMQTVFGPTVAGLALTIFAATVLEVCSEGSAPIAGEILTTAKAPGNSFGFLMSGVASDYTEVVAVQEATKSWKTAFFLPLVTLPQVIILAVIMNMASI